MGIGSKYIVELEEDEIKEIEYQNIVEAAYYVIVDKMERESAFKKAKELNELRKDPSNYVDNGEYIEYLDSSLKEPEIPQEKKKQIKTVAKELYEQFEYYK